MRLTPIARHIALNAVLMSAVFCSSAHAQITVSPSVQLKFNNDAKTLSFQLDYDFGSNTKTGVERQVFIDIDKVYSTGMRKSGLGGDFALLNGRLYRYSGVNGIWGWTLLKNVSYTDDGKKANWTIPQADLIAPGATFPSSIYLLGALGSGVYNMPAKLEQILHAPEALKRDPLKQPFAKDSIWNMPIGSNAQFIPANLSENPGTDGWTPMPTYDPERIVFTPEAPLTQVKTSTVGWSGGDRCVPTSEAVIDTVPLPTDYIIINNRNNNGAAILNRDLRTISQMQPLTRCEAGGVATAWVGFTPVDLHGSGITGAHGGSKLSTLGGTFRLGELRPLPAGTDPYSSGMRHAIKINVDTRSALHPCSVKTDCYTWPAQSADWDALTYYGSQPGLVAAPVEMKMGALLALAGDVDIRNLGLKTDAAKQLAWTLQNYGAYITDDSGGAAYGFGTEEGTNGSFVEQFKADWGFEFGQRVRDGSDWVKDMQTLIKNLSVVTNNKPGSIGGGGTPRQPLLDDLPM